MITIVLWISIFYTFFFLHCLYRWSAKILIQCVLAMMTAPTTMGHCTSTNAHNATRSQYEYKLKNMHNAWTKWSVWMWSVFCHHCFWVFGWIWWCWSSILIYVDNLMIQKTVGAHLFTVEGETIYISIYERIHTFQKLTQKLISKNPKRLIKTDKFPISSRNATSFVF